MGQSPLYLIGILFGIVNGSTRFIWGFLMDKFNFKILMVIISILEITICFSIYFFSDNPVIFVIENLLVATCLSGTFTTITPLFNKVFKEVGAEMYGLTGFFIGLASFLGPVLTKILIKEDDDYIIVYSVGGGICIVNPYYFVLKDLFLINKLNLFSYFSLMKIQNIYSNIKGFFLKI